MYFLDLLASVDVYFVFFFYLFDISEIFLCRQKKKPGKLKKKKRKTSTLAMILYLIGFVLKYHG